MNAGYQVPLGDDNPPRISGTTGRPPRHGGQFIFGDSTTWNDPDTATTTDTRLYGPRGSGPGIGCTPG